MRALIIAVIFLCTGCMRGTTPIQPVKFVNSSEMTWIIEKVMAKWENEEGRRLRLAHSEIRYRGNRMTLRLELFSQAILEVRYARYLMADFVEDILREINTNPIVSEGLVSYPFSPDQLCIDINFESFFGKYVDPLYIGYIEMRQGMMRYYAFDQKDQERYLWHARCEPYFKTREIASIQRATRKQFDLEHMCPEPGYIEEYFDIGDPDNPECRYKRKF